MLSFIIAPLVGSVIGYITNDIAIRMLFRPHQAKYLFGRKLPFTPGIIPKEKGRIAASIGSSISANLMNREVLEKNLLSEEMLSKIEEALDRFFISQRHNPESLRMFLEHYLSKEEIDEMASKGSNDLSQLIYKKLASSSVGDQIAHAAVAHVMKKMQHFGSSVGDRLADEGISHGGGWGDMLSRGIRRVFGRQGSNAAQQFISALAEPVEQALSSNINEMLRDKSEEIVRDLICTETEALLSRPMSELLKNKEEDLERAKASIIGLYRSIITERLPRILAAVDISKIVENRINEMDMNEAEGIIMQVMSKELRAIVWLGAGLGFLMGFVNCLIL